MTSFLLASGSTARRALLNSAGFVFEVSPSSVDEDQLRKDLKQSNVASEDWAFELAAAKGLEQSQKHPGKLVVAADQILMHGDNVISKSESRLAAIATLKTLSGSMHRLISAAVLYKDGEKLWSHTDVAKLWMEDLSNEQIITYLDTVGDDILNSVGCYHFEGPGIQLFKKTDGEYHTILGLPLLPLVGALKAHGVGLF